MLKGLKKQKDVKLGHIKRRPGLNITLSAVHYSPRAFNGQVSLEFTFCMIVVLIMIYGVMRVFQWTGRDLAERRIAHERVLTASNQGACQKIGCTPPPFSICGVCIDEATLRDVALNQIDPYFYTPVTMNAVWNGT